MVINENNTHINSFTKGMNSDTSYDQMQNQQYVFGKNVRITKNQSLGGASDYSTLQEGIITPVPAGKEALSIALTTIGNNETILAVKSVEDLAVIISVDDNNNLVVRKLTGIENESGTEKSGQLSVVWKGIGYFNGATEKQASVLLYKELDNVIKLYIATGITPIIELRVDGSQIYGSGNTWRNVDYLINNRIIPIDRVFISDVIDGRLPASQVQYTYRFYNKYGNTTQLAPLTNKLQIIDSSRDKEIGNAEGTNTARGLQLTIPIKSGDTDYQDLFERMLVFRLTFIKPNEDSEVALIYDDKITKNNSNNFVLNDVGIDPLLVLTIEEFSALSGIIVTPKHIENNQNYMFCANTKDETIITDLNIVGGSISKVYTEITLADSEKGKIPRIGSPTTFNNSIKSFETGQPIYTVRGYILDRGVDPDKVFSTYNDMFTSSLLRSLRRGEDYKYGIVYYDKYGRRSDVKYIDTVRIPEIDYTSEKTIPFKWNLNKLEALPIGVSITLPLPKTTKGELIKDIIGCQIVRRSSSEIYLKTLLQVALARPVLQGLTMLNGDYGSEKKSPFYPTGFLSTDNMTITPPYYVLDKLISINDGNPVYGEWYAYTTLHGGLIFSTDEEKLGKFDAYTRNKTLFLIFSSEINYRRDDVIERLNISDTTISELLYVYPDYNRYGDLSAYKNNLTRDYEQGLTFFGILDEDNLSWQIGNVHVETKYETVDLGPQSRIDNAWVVSPSIFLNAREAELKISGDIPGNYFLFVVYDGYGNQSLSIVYDGDNLFNNNTVRYCLNNNRVFKLLFKQQLGTFTSLHYVNVPAPSGTSVKIKMLKQLNTDVNEKEVIVHKDCNYWLSANDKENIYWVFNYFNKENADLSNKKRIKSVKDVKIPNWSDGFSNVLWGENSEANGPHIIDAIKLYKSFTTTIDQSIYNNWVASCKYDFKVGYTQSTPNQNKTNYDDYAEFMEKAEWLEEWLDNPSHADSQADRARAGYIGPGPSCFLISTDGDFGTYSTPKNLLYTSICNIQHAPKTDLVQSDELTLYYGFGNYFKLKLNSSETGYIVDNGTNSTNLIVFDGDIYITPHEFTTQYKTYNFESADTLQSMLITNYIPLESKVNTYFDYGMNLLNTENANLIYEPGLIEGIINQERPAHQYNMIYSDNDASNDVFTLISTDKDETNIFKQRAYFSEPKTNGEFIDNFLIFKAASFIDVDSKFGPITHLFTNRNALYYWQENAFGKFSVNERSLINDTNGNTIMLGQAGILSRYDYISNKYGMREGDMCACAADQRVFWVDINNKAIVAANGEQAINYGELLNVLNIINTNISLDIPRVDYDLQNSELLCQCLKENNKAEQLIFNTKYNIATSLYTRDYDIMMDIKNHIFGLKVDNTNHKIHATKYNYLKDATSDTHSFLSPMTVKFVVNPNASITKVFDNQLIVPIKRNEYKSSLVDVIKASFKTDVYDKIYAFNSEMWTDREGNVLYAIPRWGNEQYGNRLRGKWMETEFTTTSPADFTTISHVITKFRQSFS